MTPHIGGHGGRQSHRRMSDLIRDNTRRYLSGEPLKHVVRTPDGTLQGSEKPQVRNSQSTCNETDPTRIVDAAIGVMHAMSSCESQVRRSHACGNARRDPVNARSRSLSGNIVRCGHSRIVAVIVGKILREALMTCKSFNRAILLGVMFF